MFRKFPKLLEDREGAAAVEFALTAPILLLAIMGVFDMGYNMYTASLLEGAIQKAARDSTIENASRNASALDSHVTDIVQDIAPNATLSFSRKSYATFSDVGQPEDFSDYNGNGICDDSEPYEDANGNNAWDADKGSEGFGGARDAVVYEVTVTYPRVVPIAKLAGQSGSFTMVSTTVLRNQPYDNDEDVIEVEHCT